MSRAPARRRLVPAAFALSAMWLPAVAAFGQTAPSPTPTPRPRLTGGFGRTPAARPIDVDPPPPVAAEDAPGQALSDAVRAATDRKASKAKGGVSITNQTLVTNPQKGKLTTYATTPAPPAKSKPASTTTAEGEGSPSGSAPSTTPQVGDETYWRETARATRDRVQHLKARVAELDAAARRMENDFYNWDDGQYRDRVIKPAWDKTKQELDTAKQELARAEQDLTDLPDRARKAGALPGWIRE